jgi:hypothetical protein
MENIIVSGNRSFLRGNGPNVDGVLSGSRMSSSLERGSIVSEGPQLDRERTTVICGVGETEKPAMRLKNFRKNVVLVDIVDNI